MTRKDFEKQACAICGKPAHYWSQDGFKDGRARGEVVFHCQGCRKDGRRVAGSIDARINFRGRQEMVRSGMRAGDPFWDGLKRLFKG